MGDSPNTTQSSKSVGACDYNTIICIQVSLPFQLAALHQDAAALCRHHDFVGHADAAREAGWTQRVRRHDSRPGVRVRVLLHASGGVVQVEMCCNLFLKSPDFSA